MTKIMVVEDSNLMQAVTNFIKKESTDVEVVTARNGEEVVPKYQTEHPNLVFMDIKMPGMDSLTALEKIAAVDAGAKVVMCTAMKDLEQEERAMKAGAKGYITKPFSREDITKALSENLGL